MGFKLNEVNSITVYCLANPNKEVSYSEEMAIRDIEVFLPDDYMLFIELESIEENYSSFSLTTIEKYVEESLEEIVKQNYEAIFLVAKTPKKSPNRKLLAMLKGIHRCSGFQLWCEVYDEKRIKNN